MLKIMLLKSFSEIWILVLIYTYIIMIENDAFINLPEAGCKKKYKTFVLNVSVGNATLITKLRNLVS